MEYNFENFVVGKCNKIAFTTCKSTAEVLPYTLYNPLYIYGDNGTGKTHLMKAISNYAKNKKLHVLCLNSDDIFTYLEEIRNDLYKFRDRLIRRDLIIFDDIFDINYSNSLVKDFEEHWCEIFDYLLLNNKPMIFTGNIEIENLKKMYGRLGSRMEYGMCIKMFPHDKEVKTRILKNKLEEVNAVFSDSLIEYIVDNCKEVIKLDGSINRLISYKKMMNLDELNLENCYTEIKEYLGE